MSQTAIPKKSPPSADVVMTPYEVALDIVNHFQPKVSAYDPCCGDGAFINAMNEYHDTTGDLPYRLRSEIREGMDFFSFRGCVEWIISNPPYSILRPWLQHSYKSANNVVYLVQQPRPFFKAIMEDAERAGFGLKEIYRIPVPTEWKEVMQPFGGGYCAAHWQRGWRVEYGVAFTGSNSLEVTQ